MKRRHFLLASLAIFLPWNPKGRREAVKQFDSVASTDGDKQAVEKFDAVAFTDGDKQGVMFLLFQSKRSLTFGRGNGERWLAEINRSHRLHGVIEIVDVELMRELYDAVLPGQGITHPTRKDNIHPDIIHPDTMQPKLVRRIFKAASLRTGRANYCV